jgi:hypothetical protein
MAINARDAAVQANERTVGRWSSLLGVVSVLGHAANRGNRRDSGAYRAALQARRQDEACLVRCVFGDFFRPPLPADSAWRTPTVLDLAMRPTRSVSFPAATSIPTGSPCWPTPWKRRGQLMSCFWGTSARWGRTSAAASRWTRRGDRTRSWPGRRPTCPHQCRDDRYSAVLVVHDDRIVLRRSIDGPRKRETIEYDYR